MGNPANLNFGANQQFSMSAWIRTSGTGPHMLVSKRGGVGYQFRHTSLGWFLRIDEGSNVETFTSANLSDGAWHHVVFGRDGGKHFIYVDGVLSASTTDSTLADLTDPASFVIGNSATGNLDPWLGTIDDVRVYNRALSSQDIQALFAVGNATPTPTSSPTACHSLDNTQPVPSGYAASYNPFTVQQELLLQAECNSTNITVTLGNGNTGSPTSWDGRVWVFTQGYQLLNNTWQPVTYTCTGEQVPISGGAWCSGEATGTLDSQSTAYLGYTCQWHGATSSYKCGCTDASCTTPLWQAQQIQ
jgi:hypothetical protein